MKKHALNDKPKKMKLSRETLRALETSDLKEALGGTTTIYFRCKVTLLNGSGCN